MSLIIIGFFVTTEYFYWSECCCEVLSAVTNLYLLKPKFHYTDPTWHILWPGLRQVWSISNSRLQGQSPQTCRKPKRTQPNFVGDPTNTGLWQSLVGSV